MKISRSLPKHYAGSDMESIASVLNIGYILLPIFLGVSLTRQLFESDFEIAIIIAFSLFFSFFIRFQFLRGHLKQSVILVVVFFNILLTTVCTLGNGLNDIGVIGYPIIIGFSGIILDQRNLIVASSLSILGIVWLVVSHHFHLIEINEATKGSPGDFIVSALFVVLGGFIAFNLTNNMRIAILDAQREIGVSKIDAQSLEKESKEKLEIIEEIHRAVINSLGHIQNLLEHKRDSEELGQSYDSIKSKVTVIEVAHEILLAAKSPIQIDIRELTIKLLNKHDEFLKTSVLGLDGGNQSHYIPLDLAINYGICLLEMLSRVDDENNEALNISLRIKESIINLKIEGFEGRKDFSDGIVIDLLVQQLKGKIEISTNDLQLSFQA